MGISDKPCYPWGHSRPYNAYSNYFKKIFGERLQKLSIDAGFTCPNRDGSKGYGGCTYCDNAAFNPSYCSPEKPVAQQIVEGMSFHRRRYPKVRRYLAYFQVYSNTYADLDRLKRVYGEALAHEQVAGLVIGTRPDCIDEEKLAYFAQLSEKHYLILEYGIESCCDRTLREIGRGHDFATAVRALEMTRAYGVRSGAHFIFGLPDETPGMWMDWTKVISALPVETLKFHQLQIIRNTPMAETYLREPRRFHTFRFPEYVDFMVDFLERLNPDLVIERFAGEVPPRFLQLQAWELIRNEQVVQFVEKRMLERGAWQGRLWLEGTSK
ncbi:MAG: TIGR01212 family radical SAM protein [Bacteroidales bacterium]|nr:TIGR01212 family radical SAM protein [Bacteroidales bacterium]